MERMPHIATHIRKVARERLGHDLVTKTGNLTEAEIEEE